MYLESFGPSPPPKAISGEAGFCSGEVCVWMDEREVSSSDLSSSFGYVVVPALCEARTFVNLPLQSNGSPPCWINSIKTSDDNGHAPHSLHTHSSLTLHPLFCCIFSFLSLCFNFFFSFFLWIFKYTTLVRFNTFLINKNTFLFLLLKTLWKLMVST